MGAKRVKHFNPKKTHLNLQDFLDDSVMNYDGFGRVLSLAMKDPIRPRAKK